MAPCWTGIALCPLRIPPPEMCALFERFACQWNNYRRLLRWLVAGYYAKERKGFWVIQSLLLVTTISGFLWMTGLILGFSHRLGEGHALAQWLFPLYRLPLWQWLSVLSLLGLLSAYTFYLSFRVSMRSAVQFQSALFDKVVSASIQRAQSGMALPPDGALLRLLKSSTHMAGLVSRRLALSFIPLLTCMLSTAGLFYLDAMLTFLLLPLVMLYFFGLYHINRHAAAISDALNTEFPRVSQCITFLVQRIKTAPDTLDDVGKDGKSAYLRLSRIRYDRRLVEMHVGWLKTVLLVAGVILMAGWYAYRSTGRLYHWSDLLIYLVVLRFAANALGLVSMASVAFSRFYPDLKALRDYLDEKQVVTLSLPGGNLDTEDFHE